MTNWQTIKRFLEPIKYSPGPFLVLIWAGFIFGINQGLIVSFAKGFFDSLQGGNRAQALYYIQRMGGLFLLKNLSNYFIRNGAIRFFTATNKHIQYDALRKYTTSSSQYTESFGTGKIQEILSSGTSAWHFLLEALPNRYLNIIISAITIIILIITNLPINAIIIVFVIILSSILIARWGSIKLKELRKNTKKIHEEKSAHIVRRIMSKFEILQQSNINKEYMIGMGLMDKILQLRLQQKTQQIWSFDIPKTMIELMQLGIVVYVGWGMIQGKYTIGDVTLFWMVANMVKSLNQEIGDAIDNFYSNRISIEKLREFIDNSGEILGYSNGSNFQSQGGSIVLKDINYGYNKNSLIFNNFSLIIQGGKKTALVGPSGGGKSTLIKLVAGYLHPQSGEILVDDQALPTPQNCHSEGSIAEGRNQNIDPLLHSGGHISLQSYYPHIGYLTQEPSVFDGTIWENLTYGMTETQQDKDLEQTIDQVIKLSKCEFIYEFKDGLQTEIGEKGVRLSGGQRQRLAIAKIMLKDPSIILLDEPTSALDSYNEEQVTQALNNLFQGKTVIIIAHRLQTVKNADEILYIAKDEEANSSVVIERGTHAQLLELKGEYHTMVELQSGF